MTEHSKIPLPERSLFERAEEVSREPLFATPPVPRQLAEPVNRKARRAHRRTDDEANPLSSAAPLDAGPNDAATIRPVRFSEQVHPVDRDLLARNGLIRPEAQVTALLEEFRIVKRRLIAAAKKAHAAGAGAAAQRVLVCSPMPDEGKSFCATNLALAMAAEKDSEVLLVDADFAKPSILSLLGLPRGPGFMDVLANPSVGLEDCVLRTDIAGLFVLPAGNHTNSDTEYLASRRTDEVLAQLTRDAPNRIVIFDSPPALAASPAAELANHVGQAIVVARADRTGQTALEDALTLLSACPDIKLLLNAAHFTPSGRRFGSYYGQEA